MRLWVFGGTPFWDTSNTLIYENEFRGDMNIQIIRINDPGCGFRLFRKFSILN